MRTSFYSITLLILLFAGAFMNETEPIREQRTQKDYALFFAVKDYDEWANLRNPIKDAKAIATDLEQHYGFETEVVENPTRAQILQKLEAYRRKTYSKDAQLFIFFSGHGTFVESTKEGFFIPREGRVNDPFQDSYFPHSRLERAVTTIPCRHILLAIDACYSGTFDDALALGKGNLGQRPGETDKSGKERFIERVLSYQSRLYLTSGGKERTPDGQDHSPFTLQFLTALRSFGGSNKILDFDELKSYMKEATPRPHAGQFEGHEPGGDFLFVLDEKPAQINDIRKDLAAWQQAESTNTLSAYQNYLSRYPSGEFKEQAQAKINQLEQDATLERDILAWNRAKSLNTKASYEQYLREFPNGSFRGPANSAIQRLNPTSSAAKGTDAPPRDPSGRTYKTIVLNGKTWLAENLAYDVGEGCWCYDDKEENCKIYGRLYNWEAAKKACTALGNGWRLPTDEDWIELAKSFGGYFDGELMESVKDYKKGYTELTTNGTNGFGAQISGFRNTSGGYISPETGHYASGTTVGNYSVYTYYFDSVSEGLYRFNHYGKTNSLSCRCIKD